jgi:dolichol kinase
MIFLGEQMSELFNEVRRKLLHMVWGFFLAALLWFGVADWRLFATFLVINLLASLSYALTRKWKHPAFAIFFDLMERPEGKKCFLPGMSALYYHLSFFILAAFFPKEAAVAGMIILAIGDTVALWYGVFLGKVPVPWNKKKDLDARFIAAVICTVILLPVLPWWQGLIASVIGMFIESFDYKRGWVLLDDNFLVPLAAGAVIWILQII